MLCLALALAGGPAAAKAGKAQPAAMFTLDFAETDIEAASQAMGALLGRQVVVDPRVKGKVTLRAEQGVTKAQAYAIFVSALRGLGYAVVESNGLLKVVPEADAKLQAGTVVLERSGILRDGDAVATQIFRIVHENANNLVSVLRPLVSPNNVITANPGNNTLVITDYAANLVRLGTIIEALDTPSATDVEVIPLQHVLASNLAVTVQRLSESAAPAAGPGTAIAGSGMLSIMADPHINALLVRAPNQARLAAVRALVARLDRPGSASGNIHVIYLKNADASRLATVPSVSSVLELMLNSCFHCTPMSSALPASTSTTSDST